MWGGIKSASASAWGGIKSTAGTAWRGIKSAAGWAWDGIKSGASAAWGAIKSGADTAWGWTSRQAMSAGAKVKEAWGGVKNFMGDLWNGIKNTIKDVWDWIANKWQEYEPILAAIGSTIQTALQPFDLISGAVKSIRDLINGETLDWENYFPDWVITTVGKIGEAIDKVIDGIKWLWDNDPNKKGEFNGLSQVQRMGMVDYGVMANQLALSNKIEAMTKEGLVPQTLESLQRLDRPQSQSRSSYPDYSALASMPGLHMPVELVTPPPQRVDVDVNTIKSEIRVRYDGPLRGPEVINAATTANAVPDGGLAVGRP